MFHCNRKANFDFDLWSLHLLYGVSLLCVRITPKSMHDSIL